MMRVMCEYLKVSLARRIRELESMVDEPDRKARVTRRKRNDLESDKTKFIKRAVEPAESLTDKT